MTVAMLALAGFPATVGLLRQGLPHRGRRRQRLRWLGVVIVLGSALSLAYYLRVVAAIWTDDGASETRCTPAGRPVMAGGAAARHAIAAR